MSTTSSRDQLLAALREAGVVVVKRGLVASRPAWEPASRVGVGVMHVASGRARQVGTLLPPSVTDSLGRPVPGRPLLREFSRRALGALLKRSQPQEMLYENGVVLGWREAHRDAWEPFPQPSGDTQPKPASNDPLRLLAELRASAGGLHVTVGGGGLPALIAERDEPAGTSETWSVLALERCDEPFDGVDLFARWNAG